MSILLFQIIVLRYTNDNIDVLQTLGHTLDHETCVKALHQYGKRSGHFVKKSGTVKEFYFNPTEHWVMRAEIVQTLCTPDTFPFIVKEPTKIYANMSHETFKNGGVDNVVDMIKKANAERNAKEHEELNNFCKEQHEKHRLCCVIQKKQ